MLQPAKLPGKKQTTFVDQKSIRNFAGASSALTVLMNVTMLIYFQVRQSEMPAPAIAGFALLLCVAYSLTFLKRQDTLPVQEYVWLTALNSALLFSSLTGINNMLKQAENAVIAQKTGQAEGSDSTKKAAQFYKMKTDEASFGFSDLKDIIFPRQTWINLVPNTTGTNLNVKKANELTDRAIQNMDSTEAALNKSITAQNAAYAHSDSLANALAGLRKQYIRDLSQMGNCQTSLNNYSSAIAGLNQKLNSCEQNNQAIITQLKNLQSGKKGGKVPVQYPPVQQPQPAPIVVQPQPIIAPQTEQAKQIQLLAQQALQEVAQKLLQRQQQQQITNKQKQVHSTLLNIKQQQKQSSSPIQ